MRIHNFVCSSSCIVRSCVSFFFYIHREAESKRTKYKKTYEQSLLLACWRVWKRQRKTKMKKYEERNATEKIEVKPVWLQQKPDLSYLTFSKTFLCFKRAVRPSQCFYLNEDVYQNYLILTSSSGRWFYAMSI